MDVQKEAKKRARILREEFRQRGDVYDQRDFEEALYDRLADLAEGSMAALVKKIAADVDREACQDRGPFLDGVDWGSEMEGDFALGDNKRVAKRSARKEHYIMHIELDDRNMRNVMRANLHKHDVLEKLEPFWGPDMTMEQAIAGYRRANPEG
jgi:hypothetical protein